jgi:hypothetical protein
MWFALGTAIVLQFVMPFIYPIVGHDAPVHLNWLEQFPRLFRDGNLYPRWMPDSFWGFGSPAFYFYPPLAYWCASLISFIFPDSPVAIYQTLGFLATIASVGTSYLYLRSLVRNKQSALMGALIYGVFPYRLLDLYLRNAIGEHIAFVFLPLILLGIEISLHTEERKVLIRSIVISAIGWAGLLLTNIPTAVIAIYTVPIYSWIRSREGKKYGKFFFPIFGACIGAMIAAIYLLPISEYVPEVRLAHLWDLQNSQGNTGYALVDIAHGNYRYFYAGLIVTLFSGIWLLYKFYSGKKGLEGKNIYHAFVSFLLIAIMIQIPFFLKLLADNYLPLFKLIQFSYRWDILILITSSVYVALYYEKEKSVKWFVGISSLIAIFIALGYFFTMNGLHWKYEPVSGHVDAPEYMTYSANSDRDLATTAFKEHAMDPLITSENDSFHVHIYAVTPESIRFGADGPHDNIHVIFHRMFFTAWVYSVEGRQKLLFADSLGRLNVVLEADKNTGIINYTLTLQKRGTETTGALISLAGLSILGIMICLTIFWRNPKVS